MARPGGDLSTRPGGEGPAARWGETTLCVQVRPNDLDSLGHVNNAVVLEYLEAGRWNWLAEHGISPGEGVTAVVARAEIDYRAEVPFGQITVSTDLVSPTAEDLEDGQTAYRAVFRQRILRPDASGPAVEAEISVACIDTERRCLVPLEDFLAVPGRERA